jgi:hypothetical protein
VISLATLRDHNESPASVGTIASIITTLVEPSIDRFHLHAREANCAKAWLYRELNGGAGTDRER